MAQNDQNGLVSFVEIKTTTSIEYHGVVFKFNIAKICVYQIFGGCPWELEFWGTKIVNQFTNDGFLYLAMMYPQYVKGIT